MSVSEERSHGKRQFYEIPFQSDLSEDKEASNAETKTTILGRKPGSLLSYIDQNVIGRNKVFSGPFGLRKGECYKTEL